MGLGTRADPKPNEEIPHKESEEACQRADGAHCAGSADTAIRLARYFGTTPEFWLNLQSAYELSVAIAEHGPAIVRDVHPPAEMAA
jgi:hypothetical protein